MPRPRCLLTESQMSSIAILTSEPNEIVSLLSTSSIVEEDGRNGVKFDQLTVFCLFFPSAWEVKATSRGHKLCADLGKLTLARVSWASWYSLYTDGPPMEAPDNSCGAAHFQGSWTALSVVMHCTKGCCSSILVSSWLRHFGCTSGITVPQPVTVVKVGVAKRHCWLIAMIQLHLLHNHWPVLPDTFWLHSHCGNHKHEVSYLKIPLHPFYQMAVA